MKKFRFTGVLLVFLLSAGNVNLQDWPQYLGPLRNGTSFQKGILRSWPAKGPYCRHLYCIDINTRKPF